MSHESAPLMPLLEADWELTPLVEPGINLAIKYAGRWFCATLTAVNEQGYTVRFPTGTVVDVALADAVPMPNRAVFRVGDLVGMHWGDGSIRSAIVREASDPQCTVEWHANKPQRIVPVGELTFQEWLVQRTHGIAPGAPPPAERESVELPARQMGCPEYGPGIVVVYKDSKDFFTLGQITKAVKDAFSLEFASGDRGKASEKKLIPVPTRPVFRIGDHVLATWVGMRLFPGRIVGLSRAGYVVAWDSGEAPQIVPLGSLTFAGWT